MTTPELTPAGQLIEAARTDRSPVMSIRKAAEAAGISDGWWRQIVRGYRTVKGGVKVQVDSPADTLAAMALAVGVTPSQLRAVDREDAARALELRVQAESTTWDGDLTVVPDEELLTELGRRLATRGREVDNNPPAHLTLAARTVDPSDASTFQQD